jgi:hypothetical protein
VTLVRMLGIETRKTLRHPALWLGLLALFLLLGMFTVVSHLQIVRGVQTARGGLEQDLLAGLAFYHWTGVLVYAVIGAVIAGYDYPDRSILLWPGRGVGRPQLMSARLAAILLFGLLITCFALASLLILGTFSRLLVFGRVDASRLEVGALLPVMLHVFWSGLPYLALALLLAVASRSPLVAAVGTIAYGCVFEMLAMQAAGRFPALVRYLPANLSQVLQLSNAVLDRAAMGVPLDAARVTPVQAFLWIGMIFFALSTASLLIFLRQDLGG